MRRAPQPSTGTSRTFLVVALSAAVVVLVVSGVYLVRSGVPGEFAAGNEEAEGDEPTDLPSGLGMPGGRQRPRTAGTERSVDEDDDGIVDDFLPGDGRELEGPILHVNAESLRKALGAREWEELRRQLLVIQQDGGTVPEDVVKALVELLADERWGIDAQLALGGVRDPATGTLLADLAADPNAPEGARALALRALALSGQAAGLEKVKALLAQGDTRLGREALLALAGMGGPEGVKPLLDVLAAHPRDELTDAVLAALAKARDADATIGQVLRDARNAGDANALEMLRVLGDRIREKAGPELRREVRAIVESPAGLAAFEGDANELQRLRAMFLPVAAAMGGDAFDAVIALARGGGEEKLMALNALRAARGDESAQRIAGLLHLQDDHPSRYAIAASLGEIGSREGTLVLHQLLDDKEGDVREMAAAALVKVRDPRSVPVLLTKLEGVRADEPLARLYVQALGRIGVRDALPKLQKMAEAQDDASMALRPYVLRAIQQIETGNPDATSIGGRGPDAARSTPGNGR